MTDANEALRAEMLKIALRRFRVDIGIKDDVTRSTELFGLIEKERSFMAGFDAAWDAVRAHLTDPGYVRVPVEGVQKITDCPERHVSIKKTMKGPTYYSTKETPND